jgi:hypothetical protein
MEEINNNINNNLIEHLNNIDSILSVLQEKYSNLYYLQNDLLPYIKNIKDINKRLLSDSIKLSDYNLKKKYNLNSEVNQNTYEYTLLFFMIIILAYLCAY